MFARRRADTKCRETRRSASVLSGMPGAPCGLGSSTPSSGKGGFSADTKVLRVHGVRPDDQSACRRGMRRSIGHQRLAVSGGTAGEQTKSIPTLALGSSRPRPTGARHRPSARRRCAGDRTCSASAARAVTTPCKQQHLIERPNRSFPSAASAEASVPPTIPCIARSLKEKRACVRSRYVCRCAGQSRSRQKPPSEGLSADPGNVMCQGEML